jgi:hypothetical protein
MPAGLEEHYRKRLADRERATKRRSALILSSAVAASLVFLTALGLWFYAANNAAQLRAWVDSANNAAHDLETSHDLAKARHSRETIAQEGRRFIAEPQLSSALSELDSSIQKEEARAAAFAQQLKAASQAPLDSPDDVSLKATAAMARTSPEKLAVQELQDRINDYRQKKQRDADAEFAAAASALRVELDRELTPASLAADKRTYMMKAAQCAARIAELRGSETVSHELRDSLAQSLEALLTQKKDAIGKQEAEQMLVETVIASGRSFDQRVAAMTGYCREFPEGSKAAAFTQALSRKDAEKAVLEWDRKCNAWFTPWPVSLADAAGRVKQIDDYLKEFPAAPLGTSISRYRELLKKGLDACGDDGAMVRVLKPLLSTELMTNMFVVETSQGKLYYTPERPKLRKNSTGDEFPAYFTENLKREDSASLIKGESIKTVRIEDADYAAAVHAPQYKISLDGLHQIADRQFDTCMEIPLLIAQEVVTSEKLNPVLKGRLLLRLFQVQQENMAWVDGDAFKKTISELAQLNLGDVSNWMDPNHGSGSNVLESVQRIIKDCPDPAQTRATQHGNLQTIISVARPSGMGFGVLAARPGEPLEVHTRETLTEGMTAEVIPSTPSADTPLLVIGTVHEGRIVLDQSALKQVPEGSLVFLFKKH